MKVEIYRQSKSIRLLFKNITFNFALGKYSNKIIDYYEVKSFNKKVIQSKFFWLCFIGDSVWRIKK